MNNNNNRNSGRNSGRNKQAKFGRKVLFDYFITRKTGKYLLRWDRQRDRYTVQDKRTGKYKSFSMSKHGRTKKKLEDAVGLYLMTKYFGQKKADVLKVKGKRRRERQILIVKYRSLPRPDNKIKISSDIRRIKKALREKEDKRKTSAGLRSELSKELIDLSNRLKIKHKIKLGRKAKISDIRKEIYRIKGLRNKRLRFKRKEFERRRERLKRRPAPKEKRGYPVGRVTDRKKRPAPPDATINDPPNFPFSVNIDVDKPLVKKLEVVDSEGFLEFKDSDNFTNEKSIFDQTTINNSNQWNEWKTELSSRLDDNNFGIRRQSAPWHFKTPRRKRWERRKHAPTRRVNINDIKIIFIRITGERLSMGKFRELSLNDCSDYYLNAFSHEAPKHENVKNCFINCVISQLGVRLGKKRVKRIIEKYDVDPGVRLISEDQSFKIAKEFGFNLITFDCLGKIWNKKTNTDKHRWTVYIMVKNNHSRNIYKAFKKSSCIEVIPDSYVKGTNKRKLIPPTVGTFDIIDNKLNTYPNWNDSEIFNNKEYIYYNNDKDIKWDKLVELIMENGDCPKWIGYGFEVVWFDLENKISCKFHFRDISTKHKYILKAPISSSMTIGSYGMYYFKTNLPKKCKFLKITDPVIFKVFKSLCVPKIELNPDKILNGNIDYLDLKDAYRHHANDLGIFLNPPRVLKFSEYDDYHNGGLFYFAEHGWIFDFKAMEMKETPTLAIPFDDRTDKLSDIIEMMFKDKTIDYKDAKKMYKLVIGKFHPSQSHGIRSTFIKEQSDINRFLLTFSDKIDGIEVIENDNNERLGYYVKYKEESAFMEGNSIVYFPAQIIQKCRWTMEKIYNKIKKLFPSVKKLGQMTDSLILSKDSRLSLRKLLKKEPHKYHYKRYKNFVGLGVGRYTLYNTEEDVEYKYIGYAKDDERRNIEYYINEYNDMIKKNKRGEYINKQLKKVEKYINNETPTTKNEIKQPMVDAEGGCGKSYQNIKLADENTLIFIPRHQNRKALIKIIKDFFPEKMSLKNRIFVADSFFRTDLGGKELSDCFNDMNNANKKKMQNTNLLIFDEVWCFEEKKMIQINNLIKLIRNDNKDFGGLPLKFTGDIGQTKAIGTPFPLSKLFKRLNIETKELTINYRSDKEYVKLCREVRNATKLSTLENLYIKFWGIPFNDADLNITFKRDHASEINECLRIPTESKYPVKGDKIRLRRKVFIKNPRYNMEKLKYDQGLSKFKPERNESLVPGELYDLINYEPSIYEECNIPQCAITLIAGFSEIKSYPELTINTTEYGPQILKNFRYEKDWELGYATTIHKGQSLTLNKINIYLPFNEIKKHIRLGLYEVSYVKDLFYTALSRVQNKECVRCIPHLLTSFNKKFKEMKKDSIRRLREYYDIDMDDTKHKKIVYNEKKKAIDMAIAIMKLKECRTC